MCNKIIVMALCNFTGDTDIGVESKTGWSSAFNTNRAHV